MSDASSHFYLARVVFPILEYEKTKYFNFSIHKLFFRNFNNKSMKKLKKTNRLNAKC